MNKKKIEECLNSNSAKNLKFLNKLSRGGETPYII